MNDHKGQLTITCNQECMWEICVHHFGVNVLLFDIELIAFSLIYWAIRSELRCSYYSLEQEILNFLRLV